MPSYDDDLPTPQEEALLKELLNVNDLSQRRVLLTQLKNLVIGSSRSKTAFYHAGALDILHTLLTDYSSSSTFTEVLIEILDCISSFAKSDHSPLLHRLVELGFIQQILTLLSSSTIDSTTFYGSCLRCLRSFFLPNASSNVLNPVPFVLLTDVNKCKQSAVLPSSETLRAIDNQWCVNVLFDHHQSLDFLRRLLLSTSKSIQLSILEILSSLCIDNERQTQLVEKDFIQVVTQILVENIDQSHRTDTASRVNDQTIGVCLKFFCSISYENPSVAQCLHETIDSETRRSLCEIVSRLITKSHRSTVISYFASKFFVHLCKSQALQPTDSYVSLQSLTTLVHLSSKSLRTKSPVLHLECLKTLIYLLDGNVSLHHTAMYTEQFLSQLFSGIFTPTKFLDADLDESTLVQIRASTITLLAVLASHHVDIQKRIAEQENLIPTMIECYRSSHRSLKLATLRLFHGLSRSVDQLHTTFNDAICDILLDALKSSDLSLVKTSSCVISNSVLEFSICRTKLISGGILDRLLSMLSHADQELSVNSIWALRNLSYLSTLKTKQDIVQGLTIDRIYSLLEKCTEEKFLLCLISLLRNLFHEKDMDALLPLFNSDKLQSTLREMLNKTYPEKILNEVQLLLDHLTSTDDTSQQHSSADSINSTCRTFLLPEYACDEMDQLDCS